MNQPLYIRYKKVTRTVKELTLILGCAKATIINKWHDCVYDEAEFEVWADRFEANKTKKCPKCNRKTYAKLLCSACIKEGREERKKKRNKPTVSKTNTDNCNRFICGRYMKDDSPGIDFMMPNPKYEPIEGCSRPVEEESMEKVRGRLLGAGKPSIGFFI